MTRDDERRERGQKVSFDSRTWIALGGLVVAATSLVGGASVAYVHQTTSHFQTREDAERQHGELRLDVVKALLAHEQAAGVDRRAEAAEIRALIRGLEKQATDNAAAIKHLLRAKD